MTEMTAFCGFCPGQVLLLSKCRCVVTRVGSDHINVVWLCDCDYLSRDVIFNTEYLVVEIDVA